MPDTITYQSFAQSDSDIQSLNNWLLQNIGPYVKGRTLEIDSGTNSLCPFFIEDNRPIHLSDSNDVQIQKLEKTWKDNRLVRDIHHLDLIFSDFQQLHADMRDVFDTVLALNISPADISIAADNIKYIIPNGGTLALIVPAYTYLYDGLDQNLEDWKRYNVKTIGEILSLNFSVSKVRYFNLAPDAAQYFSGKFGLSSLVILQKH